MQEKQENKLVRFEDVAVILHEHDGDHWMSGEDIGRCLGYAEPRMSITNIYHRNKDELDPVSVDINLVSTDGKKYSKRVFNEQGAYLITMFAKTEKSKAVRAWLASLPKLLREAGEKDARYFGAADEETIREIKSIVLALTAATQAMTTIQGETVQILSDLHQSNEISQKHLRNIVKRADSRNGGQRKFPERKVPYSVEMFSGTQLEFSPGLYIRPAVLYRAYQDYCHADNIYPVGKQWFYRAMRNVKTNLARYRRGTKDYFEGIGLRKGGVQ